MAGRHLNRLPPPAKTKHRFTTDSPGPRGKAAVHCRPNAGIKYGIYFLQHIYIVKQRRGAYTVGVLYILYIQAHGRTSIQVFVICWRGWLLQPCSTFFPRCILSTLCENSVTNLNLQAWFFVPTSGFQEKADDAGVLQMRCTAYAEARRNCQMYCAVEGWKKAQSCPESAPISHDRVGPPTPLPVEN